MKHTIFKSVFLMAFLFLYSCEDYLDKAPESTLTKNEVFKDFNNVQGFVEEMYAYVIDVALSGHNQNAYLYGDDGICNGADWHPSNRFDRGNLTFWYQGDNNFNPFIAGSRRTQDPWDIKVYQRPGIWDGGLTGIRKANLVIEKIDLLENASQEEIDVLLGQAYFFRAFFHYEIMKYWGRFPYIDKVLTDDYQLPRPDTYKESALRAHDDFQRAAELLPVNWDDMEYGQRTFGENDMRLTKGAAYAFQGKNLLLAASPLMNGSTDTYEYDTELANMAVDAFAEVLKLADEGRYALVSFENYEEVFWKVNSPDNFPISTEFIFNGMAGEHYNARNLANISMDNKVTGDHPTLQSPTHNFIHSVFGMANGLSIEDDLSGNYGPTMYDPEKPFENRDPRFYKWITIDGDVLSDHIAAGQNRIAQLYTGGQHRSEGTGSQTGYFYKKFYPTGYSQWNKAPLTNNTPWCVRMRLTDVYLMYAEALHVAKNNARTAPESYRLTAEQVVNIFRDRAGVPHVSEAIVSNPSKFMDELRRERSLELAFEVHRWTDIRRWVLAHLDEYKTKTGLDFPQDHSYFREFEIVKRVCEYPKHYWMPFQPNQTQFFEGFPQNPGW